MTEEYSSYLKGGPYHVCSEKLKCSGFTNCSAWKSLCSSLPQQLLSVCLAPVPHCDFATKSGIVWSAVTGVILSNIFWTGGIQYCLFSALTPLAEASGDNAKEAHTGLWHYRVQCLSGTDTVALLRQYQQLLCADSPEGLHFPDISRTNGNLVCCVRVDHHLCWFLLIAPCDSEMLLRLQRE